MSMYSICDICGDDRPIDAIFYLDCYGGSTGLCEDCINADIVELRKTIEAKDKYINQLIEEKEDAQFSAFLKRQYDG